jgi:hypothetical protein
MLLVVAIIVLVAVRGARSVLFFISGNSHIVDANINQFKIIGIIHVATILPLILIRGILDVSSLHSLACSKRIQLQIHKDSSASSATLRHMIANLAAEMLFSFISVFIAILEAFEYKGYYPSFADWLLISFALNNWFKQREMNIRIFNSGMFQFKKAKATIPGLFGYRQVGIGHGIFRLHAV